MDFSTPKITLQLTIGIVQTIATATILKKLSKDYGWYLVAGGAALELPVRLLDDGHNATGRETFLALTSMAYLSFVVISKLVILGAQNALLCVWRRASSVEQRLSGSLQDRQDNPKVPSAKQWKHAEEEMIITYIRQNRPTLDELVDQFRGYRDSVFAVLKTQARSEGNFIVLMEEYK